MSLFLPEHWFSPEYAELRQEVGVPAQRTFQTKPQLALAMIQRAVQQGLPFERVAADDLYGRNRAFRAGLGHLPAWNPAGVQLSPLGATQWTIEFMGKEGTEIFYKYALGDWSLVEKAGDCGETLNRTLTLTFSPSGPQVVNDTVANWRNVPPCGN